MKRFTYFLRFGDELMELIAAIVGYVAHRDESIFADDVLEVVESVLDEMDVSLDDVDTGKVRDGIVMVIDGLEDAF